MTDFQTLPYSAPRAVIFDLGGTLVDWPDWDEASPVRWGLTYDHLIDGSGAEAWPDRERFVRGMREAELGHWERVEAEHWSGPPTGLLSDGFRRMDWPVGESELLAALDAYARAIDGWAQVFPDSRATLQLLRERGYRLGLLSNTWWAAEWHNADLAAHGLGEWLHEIVYTSDLPHSKPHPSVFKDLAARLEVEPAACVMIGDRLVDDISGALGAGLRAVWKRNDRPWPRPAAEFQPTAVVDHLAELPALLQSWGGA
jgi:putative hydrolase of the HAD superfamily